MDRLAWEQAAELYGRAAVAAADAGAEGKQRCALLLAKAGAEVRAWDMGGARQTVLAVAGIARGTR